MPIVWIALVLIYIALIILFFIYVAKYVFLLGAAAMAVVVCARYFQALGENLFWGEGWEAQVHGDEPAYYSYFFDKAWRDYALIAVRAKDLMLEDGKRCIDWGMVLMNPVGWPLGVTVWGVAIVSAIPALGILIFVGLIHLAIVGSCAAVAYASALLFRLVEYLNMAAHGIYGRCPSCHERLTLPIYLCKCGARHLRLIPGPYGSIYRRCQCGESLPTLFLFGRNKLNSICPHCQHGLNTTLLTIGDLFIPIVGGVSAGKSSIMTATLVEFERKETGLTVSFPKAPEEKESVDERNHRRNRSQYFSGQTVEKTTDGQVRAFQIELEDSRQRRRLLYVYDAAGEIFRGGHDLGSLPYYSLIHSLVFLVDPFSLTKAKAAVDAAARARTESAASTDSPQDIYDQVVRSLLHFSRRRGVRNIPVAIVVTKTDAMGIRSRILATKVPVDPAAKTPPTADELRSLTVRQWLYENGASPLVRSVEQDFRNVRYFECSALGRPPSNDASRFVAHGVLEPWAWILGKNGLAIQLNGRHPTL
jgi:double-GTPase-like protein